SARSDGRLLRATLDSIERIADPPGMVVVAVPQGREHLLDRRELARSPIPVHIVATSGPADSWLTLGLRSLAPVADIAIFVSEGTLLQRDFLQRARRNYADWEHLVGKLEVVADVVKVRPSAGSFDLGVEPGMRDGSLRSLVRRWLRARSL